MAKEYDFYSMGQKAAARYWKNIDENIKETADNIEKEYGKDARMEYECGLFVALNTASINKIDFKLNSEVYGHQIEVDPNLQNNSYFGESGTSIKEDINKEYKEPEDYPYRKM